MRSDIFRGPKPDWVFTPVKTIGIVAVAVGPTVFDVQILAFEEASLVQTDLASRCRPPLRPTR
jgi:hypothetical protein